ncbi:MAG: cyclically-permuted mutarotase family protein [Cetobacterium sp.]|uniref:cyclically-permuted mutarotase family protein n=1 Tax=Cetobacterium sp. TaxID=2071632 RepID=UPI002FC92118
MNKLFLGCIISSLLFIGCSNTNQQKVETITWTNTERLPAPKGFNKQYGVAGPLAGTLNEYIVVAGGANFPYKSVLAGGTKKHYPDLFLLKDNNGKLDLINHTQLETETGYGTSITTDKGIYYIGGSTDKEISKDILLVTLSKDNKSTEVMKVGELPFTYFSGVAIHKNDKLYIVSGKQDGKDSNNFYEYDLVTKETTQLISFPGDKRSQSIGQILKDENGKEMLFVFSGASNIAYTDGYAYDFENKIWIKVAPVKINETEISLLGANSVKINENEILVIGGFNKEVWDNAVKNLGTLKGKELLEFKQDYFNKNPKDYNWNKQILIYNAKTNLWRSAGEIPFMAPCGQALIVIGNKIYSINGEIKPGVRTDKIYIGTFN